MSLFSKKNDIKGSNCKTNEKGETVCKVEVEKGVGYVRFVIDQNGRVHEIERTIDVSDSDDPETYAKIGRALTELVKRSGGT